MTSSRVESLSDAQWERIEPLLPANAGRRGHPFGPNRRVVEGIVYRYRTGIPWRDLPRESFGPWTTVWKRHRRYAGDGTWDRVLVVLLAEADAAGKVDWTVSVDATIARAHQHATNTTRPEGHMEATSNYTTPPEGFVPSLLGGERQPAGHGIGRSRGGLTSKIHAAVDGHGRPLALVVTGGQRNDGAMLAQVLADIRVPRPFGRPRTTPDAVVADRAYTSGINRRMLAARGIKTVIPQKKDEIAARKRKGSTGGRPPAFDAEVYKGRNVVERSFSHTKQWRGLATRYDKLAITYRAAAVLQECIRWSKLLGDMA
ncbi:IS5 family transposase [Xylanimonas ulmi]|uniref:IS5 family transposase n=1 Tax=Xylanimonas ulmi TaxID=228973 RepID=UPI003BF8AF72